MIQEFKTISLASSFVFPLFWAITSLISGLKKERSKRFLFVLMLCASFSFLINFLRYEGHINLYAIVFPIHTGVIYTLFPLLYLYLKSLTSEKNISTIEIVIHFVPSILIFTSILIIQNVNIVRSGEGNLINILFNKEDLLITSHNIWYTSYEIYKYIFVFISSVYVFLLIIIIRNHYKKVKELFSDNDKSELRWIRGLGYIFSLMIFFFFIIHLFQHHQIYNNPWIIGLSYMSFSIFFWYLGLNGFRQKELYNTIQIKELEKFEGNSKIPKEDIEQYLTKTEIYKKHDVSVFDLCYHFHTNRTYLSESIRYHFDLNFRGLINKYRIKESKKIIDASIRGENPFDLDCISKESGYSSYSTFFRVFKAETGITPSDYIRIKSGE